MAEQPRDAVGVAGFARFLSRLGSYSRLILFDRPGTGLSDRRPAGQVFEDRLDDILCVMEAVGSDRTALFGCHLGGRLALLFAATYPQRTRAVITFGAHPTTLADDDLPLGTGPGDDPGECWKPAFARYLIP